MIVNAEIEFNCEVFVLPPHLPVPLEGVAAQSGRLYVNGVDKGAFMGILGQDKDTIYTDGPLPYSTLIHTTRVAVSLEL